MPRTILLNNGKRIPALAWGNGSSGLTASGVYATQLGATALRSGIKHIDTAQGYDTEAETAEAIRVAGLKKADLWVTTKLSASSHTKATLEDVRRSVRESLDKLTFVPDLLLVHNPFVLVEGTIGELWKHLEALVKDGTLAGCSLGFSNFRPQDIEEIMRVASIKPVCHQLEYHPYVLAHLAPVLALHKQHSIVAEAYGPLTPILRHPGGPLKPVLARIAEQRGVDPGTILLLWIIQSGAVAVTTSVRPARIEKLVAIDSLDDLSDEEMQEIEQAGKSVHFRYYSEHMTVDFPAPDLPDGK